MGARASVRQFLSGTRKDASSKPPFLLAWRSSTFFIVMTVCLALFTDIFFYALIVPVIPFSLTIQVGLPEDQVQYWTAILLACYSSCLFVASPIMGLYADHTSSRRWPLLIGLVALAASTVLLCLGRAMWLLIVGRLLQGFSAAIVWSVGCALLADTMESNIGVAMGYVNAAMSIGLLIAPVVGGAVYAAAGYYAVYYVAFGVVIVDIIMRLGMVEKKVAQQWILQDEAATASSAGGDIEKATVPAVGIAGSSHQQTLGEPNPSQHLTIKFEDSVENQRPPATEVSADVPVNPAPTMTSPEPESQQAPHKWPILVLIKSPRLLAALYCICVEAGIMMGFDAVLALFVHSTFGWNSIAAGTLFLAVSLPGLVSPVVGMLSDRYGAKWPSFAGFAGSVPSIICLRFVTENSIGHKVLLCVLLSILGVTLSFAITPLLAEISYVIEEKSRQKPGIFGKSGVYGIGYGLFNMAFALGGTIGPLWAGYVNASAGWGTMTWSLALWGASGGVATLIWLGSKPQESPSPPNNPIREDGADL